jgi:hypothetical protein
MTKRKHRQGSGPGRDTTDWSAERTLADAERDALEQSTSLPRVDPDAWAGEETVHGIPKLQTGLPLEDSAPTLHGDLGRTDETKAAPQTVRCACGGDEFMLEAYMAVIRGKLQPVPLEVETLTCPQCGREYEAVWLEDGTVARGDFLGRTDLDAAEE